MEVMKVMVLMEFPIVLMISIIPIDFEKKKQHYIDIKYLIFITSKHHCPMIYWFKEMLSY